MILKGAVKPLCSSVGSLLRLPATKDALYPLLRSVIEPEKLTMYDLALHCAKEVKICIDQDAYFAAFSMSAASIEAILTLTCLSEEETVKNSRTYGDTVKPHRSFTENVSELRLDRLMKLSAELGWVDSRNLTPGIVEATLDDYPAVAKMLYPKLSEADLKQRMDEIENSPASAMMILIRDLRNLIHPPRWIKNEVTLDQSEFRLNCRLAAILSAEIVRCLSIRFLQSVDNFNKQVAQFESMPEHLKEMVIKQFKHRYGLA